jgi:hypothetical protein
MRRTMVRRTESDDSSGTRRTPRRRGPMRKLSSPNSGERLRICGAAGFRAPPESKYSSSSLTSTAEKSPTPQVLPGATSCGWPSAPRVAISWHCSWRAPEAQLFAAQSGAHTGAITKASTVKKASKAAFAGRARTGIVLFIISFSCGAAALEPSTLISWPRRANRKSGSRLQFEAWLCSPKSQRRTPFGNFENPPRPAAAATEEAAQSSR